MGCANNVTRINYALAATLLAAGQQYKDIAPQVGAKNGDILMSLMCRKGLTKSRVTAMVAQGLSPDLCTTLTQRVAVQAADVLRESSERTRRHLATVVESQSESLAITKVPRDKEKANLHADTVGKVVKSAAVVFGWEDDRRSALVIGGVVTDLTSEEAPAIDVESSSTQGEKP